MQAHMLYSLHSNWWKTTRPVLVAALPVPHRYYVADRVRESYKPRLEASELWGIPGLEDEEQDGISSVFRKEKKKKSQLKSIKFKNAFRRDQVRFNFVPIYFHRQVVRCSPRPVHCSPFTQNCWAIIATFTFTVTGEIRKWV